MTQRLFPADINGVAVHATSVTTLYGDTISGTLTGITPHDWTADGDGKFHTATDLAAEWKGYYATLLAGHADQLTGIQRLEGNSEAAFENTGLKSLSAAQRQNQATYGFDSAQPFTLNSYIHLTRIIQATPALQELAIQGHGLNNPPAVRYRGYTNDVQNNIDQSTLFIGNAQLQELALQGAGPTARRRPAIAASKVTSLPPSTTPAAPSPISSISAPTSPSPPSRSTAT